MEKQEINVSVENGIKELVIRNGQAHAIDHLKPEKVKLSGTISAPKNYIQKRKQTHNNLKVHVLFSREQMCITLVCDEQNVIGTVVTGVLKKNPELSKFKINSDNTWTLKELKQFLKMNRTFFSEIDENMKIVANLEKFTASVSSQIQQEADLRGNKTDNFNVKIDTNLELYFTLDMPVYLGQESKKFKVEICFDIRDKAVSVWLESVELREIEISDRDKIIDKELESFADYVIIEQ